MGKTIRHSMPMLGEPEILCLFLRKKNGLQKFQGMFYVLAALNDMLCKFHGRK